MQGRGNTMLLLAAAVWVVAALAACGGGDRSAPATGSSTSSGSTAATGPAGQGSVEKRDGGEAAGGGGRTGEEEPAGEAGSPGRRQAGKDSGGSREFVVPGGDNSVPNFGKEASAAEREQASAELQRYMRARASGNSQAVCAALSKEAVEQVESLAAALPNADSSTCATIFDAIDERTPASERANTMTGPISSLRVEGGRSFALYHGTEQTDYTIQMTREGRTWKVGDLVPFSLG